MELASTQIGRRDGGAGDDEIIDDAALHDRSFIVRKHVWIMWSELIVDSTAWQICI